MLKDQTVAMLASRPFTVVVGAEFVANTEGNLEMLLIASRTIQSYWGAYYGFFRFTLVLSPDDELDSTFMRIVDFPFASIIRLDLSKEHDLKVWDLLCHDCDIFYAPSLTESARERGSRAFLASHNLSKTLSNPSLVWEFIDWFRGAGVLMTEELVQQRLQSYGRVTS